MDKNISRIITRTVKQMAGQSGNKYVGMKTAVRSSVEYLQTGMFPDYIGMDFGICRDCNETEDCFTRSADQRRTLAFEMASVRLTEAIGCVSGTERAQVWTAELLERIPAVYEILKTDIQAAYEGDPAAASVEEVILAYPAFTAICIYRIAHELYTMKVPVVPRMMTEYGHELTGIDIHPGATIGPRFFIDHGTGVVIGETTVIGEHVKLYQNVTLGAKSFGVEPDGSLVKGIKRHPDIGNNVIIYAGATILGGDTRIGDGCVIGGNVWLTHSVPDCTTVTVDRT